MSLAFPFPNEQNHLLMTHMVCFMEEHLSLFILMDTCILCDLGAFVFIFYTSVEEGFYCWGVMLTAWIS